MSTRGVPGPRTSLAEVATGRSIRAALAADKGTTR